MRSLLCNPQPLKCTEQFLHTFNYVMTCGYDNVNYVHPSTCFMYKELVDSRTEPEEDGIRQEAGRVTGVGVLTE